MVEVFRLDFINCSAFPVAALAARCSAPFLGSNIQYRYLKKAIQAARATYCFMEEKEEPERCLKLLLLRRQGGGEAEETQPTTRSQPDYSSQQSLLPIYWYCSIYCCLADDYFLARPDKLPYFTRSFKNSFVSKIFQIKFMRH